MKSRHIGFLLTAIAAFLMIQFMDVIVCLGAGEIRPLPNEIIGVLELKTIKEPSGLCYHTQRKTLFMVDDSGIVCEFTPDGRLVREQKIQPADFEGITHDPSSGLLYTVIEGSGVILEVDPDTLECKREFVIPRMFQGKTVMKKGGQGIEGITFVADANHPHGGTFFVANQSFNLKNEEDLSAIFEIELPLKKSNTKANAVKILRFFKIEVIDLSGLYFDSRKDILYIISDYPNRIIAYSLMGQPLGIWVLPGDNQEGIALDADGIMYIAQDSGGVLKLKVDWQNMQLQYDL